MSNTAKKLNILFLEDNSDDVELVRFQLSKLKHPIDLVSVDEQHQYILQLIHNKPQMILSDHSLPSFTGKEALQIAQHVCPEVPFIFVTGTIKSPEDAAEAVLAGASGFILKDNLKKLETTIQRVLERQNKMNTMEYSFVTKSIYHCIDQLQSIETMVSRGNTSISIDDKQKIDQSIALLKSIFIEKELRHKGHL